MVTNVKNRATGRSRRARVARRRGASQRTGEPLEERERSCEGATAGQTLLVRAYTVAFSFAAAAARVGPGYIVYGARLTPMTPWQLSLHRRARFSPDPPRPIGAREKSREGSGVSMIGRFHRPTDERKGGTGSGHVCISFGRSDWISKYCRPFFPATVHASCCLTRQWTGEIWGKEAVFVEYCFVYKVETSVRDTERVDYARFLGGESLDLQHIIQLIRED